MFGISPKCYNHSDVWEKVYGKSSYQGQACKCSVSENELMKWECSLLTVEKHNEKKCTLIKQREWDKEWAEMWE